MKWQDYKKPITSTFARHAKGNFADWQNCSIILDDVSDALSTAKRDLIKEGRYADLFLLCNWTYLKWENTNMDDSAGQSLDFCSLITRLWKNIYHNGKADLPHAKMLSAFLKLLDGQLNGYLEDVVYDFILQNFLSPQELAQKEQFFLQKIEKLKSEKPEDVSRSIITSRYVKLLVSQKAPIEKIRALYVDEDNYLDLERLAKIEYDYGNIPEAIAHFKKQIKSRPNPHWSDEPRKSLMEIYQAQGNTKAYREELYQLVMGHPGEMTY